MTPPAPRVLRRLALGQGVMMLLTLRDPQWPDVLLAQLTLWYLGRYEV